MKPDWPQPDPHQPRAESGKPPGGDAYTDASAEPGRLREEGP